MTIALADAAPDEHWFVYIIEGDDGAYYTGVTTDIERRFNEHYEGARGARYFRGRKPVGVVYQESGHSRSSACQREAEIKRLRREQKQQLINNFKA